MSDTLLDSPLFRAAVEQADIGISITDAKAHILYVNPAFCRVTGYSAEDALGGNHSILSNKTTPSEVYQGMWAAIGKGESWSGRLVNRRKDGTRYLAELTITPVLDKRGAITHFLGLQRDVTALHSLECAVRNQKSLIESVVDGAPVVIALLDMHDRIVLDNHEYKKLQGDLAMAEPANIILAAVRDDLPSGFGPFRAGAHAFLDRQVRLDHANWRAPRWYTCSAAWVGAASDDTDAFYDSEEQAYLLLVAKDITRQILEQEKARVSALRALMAEEGRQQALHESLSAAVFQMEGPLNVLSSVVRLMDRRGCDPAHAALAEALEAGKAAVETLRAAIPAIAPEEPGSVNLNEVVRDVLDLSSSRFLAAGVSVAWRPQLVLPSIQGYPIRLRAMLKALVDNAVEAMNVKGWQARELSIATTSDAHGVTVMVNDSGPGLAPDLRLKAFEPFFSTKKNQGSHLGTGLSSAQQVAADHGGGIEIGPGAQAGCSVRITLPLANR